MIDLVLLAILGIVTWCVAAEGAWGASLTLLCVIFAGLLTMNFFEPVAELLQANVPLGPGWRNRWDFIAFMGLFILLVTLFRLGTEQLIPSFMEVHPLVFDGLRWGAAALTGYVAMAIVLTSLHTANLPRTFLGFEPERDNFLGMTAPDRQWLGFVQYFTENAYGHGPKGAVFDGTTTTLADGQQVLLPSFAIRYGSRREQFGTAGSAAPLDNAPAPVVVPSAPVAGPGGVNL
ncbi:MAG: CvpA family protein [Planctomycetaceae bacterium]|nr:CvpA family protein [Planctomycetaceae bacterium]